MRAQRLNGVPDQSAPEVSGGFGAFTEDACAFTAEKSRALSQIKIAMLSFS